MHILHFYQHTLHIMHSALRRLDLNLLLVFETLYRRRSVVAAADELAISPSACSHALSRLRDSLGDELFFRRGSNMQPTARADQMADDVAEALRVLSERLSDTEAFLPSTSTQLFTFAATDFTAVALLPVLIARLGQLAPNIRIKIVPSLHREALSDLVQSEAHFVVGFSDEFSATQAGVEALEGFTDRYVVATRRDHARIRNALTLSDYLAERHVAVKPWQQEHAVIDMALANHGLQREVAVELPSLMAAPFIVAHSDLLITLPRRAARQLEEAAQISIFPVPFDAPGYTLKVFFQRRHLNIPWHRWMREQLLAILQLSV